MEWLVIIAVVAVIILLWYRYTNASAQVLNIGASAPDFSLPDQTGKIHTLADYSGKWLALYFYPKDDTPGCTETNNLYSLDLFSTVSSVVCLFRGPRAQSDD